MNAQSTQSLVDSTVAKSMGIPRGEIVRLLKSCDSTSHYSSQDALFVGKGRDERPETVVEQEEGFSLLLASLGEESKQILMMRYKYDMGYKEIGKMLGLSESRIAQLHSESIEHLKERFQSHFGKGDYLDELFCRYALWDVDIPGSPIKRSKARYPRIFRKRIQKK